MLHTNMQILTAREGLKEQNIHKLSDKAVPRQ